MTRKPVIAGNWKMNNSVSESKSLVSGLIENNKDVTDVEIVVSPPYLSVPSIVDLAKGSNIKVAAQNCHFAEKGAFTGEVSCPMLVDIGCSHVIIGHSERRQYFAETDETVNKKIVAALQHKLVPIVCVGETLAQRESNNTFKVLETQIKEGLKDLTKDQMLKIIIAYEPVWAIGTGKTATPEQAQEVHVFVRSQLEKMFSKDVSDQIRILYGGSVTPDTVKGLMANADIDGALVGGASLKVDSFTKLINFNT